MKADLADKDVLEAKRAQHEEEVREKGKLLSEQKAVRISSHLLLSAQGCVLHLFFFKYSFSTITGNAYIASVY